MFVLAVPFPAEARVLEQSRISAAPVSCGLSLVPVSFGEQKAERGGGYCTQRHTVAVPVSCALKLEADRFGEHKG